MRKAFIGLATVTILLGGLTAAAVLQSPGAAAQEEGTQDIATTPAAAVDEVLSDLVDEGVITREQADRVAAALEERMGEFRRPHRPGRAGHMEAAAAAIGIEVDDLFAALRDGKTIAEVAEANNVSPETVIDAVVDDLNERLDQAVEDGKLTGEQADDIRADAPERIAAMVNGELDGVGLRGRHGPGPADDDTSGTADTSA